MQPAHSSIALDKVRAQEDKELATTGVFHFQGFVSHTSGGWPINSWLDVASRRVQIEGKTVDISLRARGTSNGLPQSDEMITHYEISLLDHSATNSWHGSPRPQEYIVKSTNRQIAARLYEIAIKAIERSMDPEREMDIHAFLYDIAVHKLGEEVLSPKEIGFDGRGQLHRSRIEAEATALARVQARQLEEAIQEGILTDLGGCININNKHVYDRILAKDDCGVSLNSFMRALRKFASRSCDFKLTLHQNVHKGAYLKLTPIDEAGDPTKDSDFVA